MDLKTKLLTMDKTNHNISLIAASGKDYSIGKDNKLLWDISEDLKRLKKLTTGNLVIMGRKTFESLSKGSPPKQGKYSNYLRHICFF